jgi:hypothetical protein
MIRASIISAAVLALAATATPSFAGGYGYDRTPYAGGAPATSYDWAGNPVTVQEGYTDRTAEGENCPHRRWGSYSHHIVRHGDDSDGYSGRTDGYRGRYGY